MTVCLYSAGHSGIQHPRCRSFCFRTHIFDIRRAFTRQPNGSYVLSLSLFSLNAHIHSTYFVLSPLRCSKSSSLLVKSIAISCTHIVRALEPYLKSKALNQRQKQAWPCIVDILKYWNRKSPRFEVSLILFLPNLLCSPKC